MYYSVRGFSGGWFVCWDVGGLDDNGPFPTIEEAHRYAQGRGGIR